LESAEDHIEKLVSSSKYERALAEIAHVLHEKLYWMIRKLVLNHEDANDVLQNTYVRVFKGLPKFRFQSSIKTWCYRIAYNESIRHLNKQKKQALLWPDGTLPDSWDQLCADP
jgi:RNA polymerase sigma-70 factor (ECF subfamily)